MSLQIWLLVSTSQWWDYPQLKKRFAVCSAPTDYKCKSVNNRSYRGIQLKTSSLHNSQWRYRIEEELVVAVKISKGTQQADISSEIKESFSLIHPETSSL